MARKRKGLLMIVLAVAITAHIALFAAGGNWRTMGMILVAVDVVAGLFVLGAIREFRKLDENKRWELRSWGSPMATACHQFRMPPFC